MLSSAKEMVKFQYDLNKSLADENRNWQERMANSAHQRQIADLKAAGLNPVLSVTGGSGANTPSGSTASVSDGAGYAAAVANLEAARINSATQMFMHTTPSANSIPGMINYYSKAAGLAAEDVAQWIGGIFGLNQADNSTTAAKVRNLFSKFGVFSPVNAIYELSDMAEQGRLPKSLSKKDIEEYFRNNYTNFYNDSKHFVNGIIPAKEYRHRTYRDMNISRIMSFLYPDYFKSVNGDYPYKRRKYYNRKGQ